MPRRREASSTRRYRKSHELICASYAEQIRCMPVCVRARERERKRESEREREREQERESERERTREGARERASAGE